jgi:endonuclease V-like protein UPF0215 family
VKIHNGKGLKGSSGDRRNWLPNCHHAVDTGYRAYCSTLYNCENWCIYKLSDTWIRIDQLDVTYFCSTLYNCENWCIYKLSDTWIKIDQLDVTYFIISLFNAQHVSNVITSIFRSLRLMQAKACIRIPHQTSRTTP